MLTNEIGIANRKNILAIDDEPVILNALRTVVEGDTYKFFGISSGDGALRYLESHTPPDLILLDVEMPELSGYDVIKQIKSKPETAHIPVIFLTAKDDNHSELEGLSLGAVDYINKPLPPALLLKRIEIHLLIETQKRDLMSFNSNLHQMVEEKTQTVVELKNAVLKTMAKLVEYRDDITGSHVERTQAYLRVMLNAIQSQGVYKNEVSSWNLELVLQSAQLHDVGKIAVKDCILQKPDKLTTEEFAQIKEHTLVGKKIIEEIQKDTTEETFLEYAKIFAVTHHEKWDGSGYPNALKGEEIPLLGRIMAIADVYDALVSDRPYKKAFSHEAAVKIFHDSRGTHFDPVLADIFADVSDKFEVIAKSIK